MNPTKINWTTAGLFSLSANDNILINNNISMCVDISLLNKRRISMAEKKDNVSAKFKDNVFCMLYADKANLLDLYNALNNSSYKNVDDLQVTTLNGGSYMKYKNDASFLLSMNLYMFEQQSSKNPNMPLRFLHYISDVMRQIFSNSTLHRRSMLKIPVPHFITFYNGKEKWIEKEEIIKLSDMFEEYTDNPEMELKVRVININGDADILNKCKTLRDYMTFVEKTRYKTDVEDKDVKTAVTEAIDECVEENILVDFFEKHREEVVEVSIYDYDEEEVRMVVARDMAEEMAVDMAEGMAEKMAVELAEKMLPELAEKKANELAEKNELISKIKLVIKKVKKEKSVALIADELEEEESDIKPVYDAVIRSAPEYNVDDIIKELKD